MQPNKKKIFLKKDTVGDGGGVFIQTGAWRWWEERSRSPPGEAAPELQIGIILLECVLQGQVIPEKGNIPVVILSDGFYNKLP